MADLTASGTSDWITGTPDTRTVLSNGPSGSYIDANNVNGVAKFVLDLQAVLGAAASLKGTQADLATRLARALDPNGAFVQGTAFPSNPVSGQVFYRVDLKSTWVYDAVGAVWVPAFDDQTLVKIDGSRAFTGTPRIRTQSPAIRLIGLETPSGKDVLIQEDQGLVKVFVNTGTEAIPVWTERFRLDATKSERNQFPPPGVVCPYAGSSAPTGWLLCDGSAVSRTTYADLFAVVGTTYGVGDGSTTFNLPDMRARVPVGVDAGLATGRITSASVGGGNVGTLGGAGGAQTHTLTVSELAAHTHGIPQASTPASGSLRHFSNTADNGTLLTSIPTDSTGNNSPHSNTQPWLALNYIIKY